MALRKNIYSMKFSVKSDYHLQQNVNVKQNEKRKRSKHKKSLGAKTKQFWNYTVRRKVNPLPSELIAKIGENSMKSFVEQK